MSTSRDDQVFNELSNRSVPLKSDLGKFLRRYMTARRVQIPNNTTKEQLIQEYQMVLSGEDSTFLTYIGIRNSEKVFLKCSERVEEEEKSPVSISHPVADVEGGIYQCVTNQLLRYTPHFVKFLDQLYYWENSKRQSFLVLEYCDRCSPLVDVLDSLTVADLKGVVFQIAYTLMVMAGVGLIHNDLHLGNIFMQKLVHI